MISRISRNTAFLIFVWVFLCAGASHVHAQGSGNVMRNLSIRPSSTEETIVSFDFNQWNAPRLESLWSVAIRIDGAYTHDPNNPTRLNVPYGTGWASGSWNQLYFPGPTPYAWNPMSFRYTNLSAGEHTIDFLFMGVTGHCAFGCQMSFLQYTATRFTVIDPNAPVIDGVCTSPDTHYYCAYGTPANTSHNTVSVGSFTMGSWMWNCQGANGGKSAGCFEVDFGGVFPSQPRAGVCASTHYSCSTGTPVDLKRASSTQYTWSCLGLNGGANSPPCSETVVAGFVPVLSLTFTADPETINQGGDSKLKWTTANASSCQGDGFDANNDVSNLSGVYVFPSATKDYGITCIGEGQSATQSVTVTVIPMPPIVDLQIDMNTNFFQRNGPITVAPGSSHILSWSSSRADSCEASSTDNSWTGAMDTNNSGFRASTRQTVIPNGLVAYTITCTNSIGTASDTVVVSVGSPVPTFKLSATKTKTGSGVGAFSVTDGTTDINNSPLDCAGNLPCTGIESGITFGLKRVITAHLGTNSAVSWSGDCDSIVTDASGNAVCTVTLTSDKFVTAKFDGPLVPNTLSLCTDNGLTPIATGTTTISRNLFPNMSERFKAFYDSDPTDCAGTEVTSTWADTPGNSTVSISGNGTTPQVITAGSTPGNENVTLTQGSDAITFHYTVQPPPCTPNCSDAPNVCSGTTFNDANSCGTNNCTGTRSCDYNFREVNP